MVGLEAMGVEDWTEGRCIASVGLWEMTAGEFRGVAKERALET